MSEPQSRVTGATLHIWKLNPKTGKPMQWKGQWAADVKSAFEWMDRNGGRETFVLNNIPPYGGRMQNPSHEVTVSPKGERTVGRPLPRKEIPGKTDRAPMTTAAREQALNKGLPPAKPGPRPKRVSGNRKPALTPEMREMQETAEKVLDQHRKDEAHELAAEGKGKGAEKVK